MKPWLLDLFCGAGGATRGYQEAGFYVCGVDVEPQPNYCGDRFVHDDALAPRDWLFDGWAFGDFDAIHASPPCQAYTSMGQRFPDAQVRHPSLIAPTREALQAVGLPYVIENVVGAKPEMRNTIRLCGSSFGLGVTRHRLFETNFAAMAMECAHGDEPGLAVYGKLDGRRLWTRADGTELRACSSLAKAQEAMGIDWMGWDELREAIPPAFTEHIGHQLMNVVKVQRELAA